jgi:hypothetical protein
MIWIQKVKVQLSKSKTVMKDYDGPDKNQDLLIKNYWLIRLKNSQAKI